MHPAEFSQFYDRNYAISVVNSFLERHARATDILAVCLDKPRESIVRSLVSSFITQQQRWNRQKKVIQLIERDEGIRELLASRRLSRIQKEKYLTYLKYYVQDLWLDEQIAAEKQLKLFDDGDLL